jgi:nicotianamine synthase
VLGADVAAETVAASLCAVHDELAACLDLRPGPRVDAAFRRLVRLAVEGDRDGADSALGDPAVRAVVGSLRAMCIEGEYGLEAMWAERIATSAAPGEELERFPYIGNYRALSAMESDAVAQFAGVPAGAVRRAAFVGSGPLPLTAFLLAARGDTRVDCIERDPTATALSRRAAAAVGIEDVDVLQAEIPSAPPHGDGRPPVDLADYDLVVLAATVGTTPERKAGVIAHLGGAMSPGAVLVARSARGLRTLLYPEVDLAALRGFDVLGVVHPTGEVINSVIVARVPGSR